MSALECPGSGRCKLSSLIIWMHPISPLQSLKTSPGAGGCDTSDQLCKHQCQPCTRRAPSGRTVATTPGSRLYEAGRAEVSPGQQAARSSPICCSLSHALTGSSFMAVHGPAGGQPEPHASGDQGTCSRMTPKRGQDHTEGAWQQSDL